MKKISLTPTSNGFQIQEESEIQGRFINDGICIEVFCPRGYYGTHDQLYSEVSFYLKKYPTPIIIEEKPTYALYNQFGKLGDYPIYEAYYEIRTY